MAAVLRYNDYRDKTFSEKMGEADAIREIEETEADNQRKANLKQNQDSTDRTNLSGREQGRSREKIAERIGIGSGTTYRKAKKVWDAAQDGDTEAQELVGAIDAEDESILSEARNLFVGGGEGPYDWNTNIFFLWEYV